MSGRILFLISIFASLLQGTILPVVFIEGFLVVFFCLTTSVRIGSTRFGLPLVLSGIIFDLFQNQKLGVTSLIFLGALGIVFLLKENVSLQKTIALSLFATVIDAVRQKLILGYIDVFPLFFIFIFSFLVFEVVWRPDTSGRIKI